MTMEIHPAAQIFPALQGEAFAALVQDIRQNGLREPIWLDAQDRVLDGRNRIRACQEAGVEPRFQKYIGQPDSILAFVLSLNLHRRHLNESQRSMVAARAATMGKGRPSENTPIGGKTVAIDGAKNRCWPPPFLMAFRCEPYLLACSSAASTLLLS